MLKSHSDFVERADPKFPVAAYYFSPKEMLLHSRNATILVTEPFKVIDAVPRHQIQRRAGSNFYVMKCD